MKLELRLSITFLLLVISSISWEYWFGTNSLIEFTSLVFLPLVFIFLLIGTTINSIRRFRELKIKVFVPVVILIFSVFSESFLINSFIWIDWKVNYKSRVKAIEFIQSQNLPESIITIPEEFGNVSKNKNKVQVIFDSEDKLTASFLLREGFAGGSLPDVFLIFHENTYKKNDLGDELGSFNDNWTIEGRSN